MVAALIAFFSVTAYGQGVINHNMAPPQAPQAQPAPPPQLPPQLPPQAPPSLPQMPFIPPMVPFVPQQVAQPTIAPAPDDFFKTNPGYLKLQEEVQTQGALVRELQDKIRVLDDYAVQHAASGYINSAGSLEEAGFYLGKYSTAIVYEKSFLVAAKERLAALLERKSKEVNKSDKNNVSEYDIYSAKNEVERGYKNVSYVESQIEFWTAEAGGRTSKKDQVEKDLKQLRIDLGVEQAKYAKLLKERRAIEQQHAGEMRQEEDLLTKTNSETVSAGDLGTDEFFGGTKSSKSSETADIAPIKSMQELREDSVREAFSEMGSLNFQTGFLEKVDTAGQVSQTVIGFIPGMSGTDVALSGVRGFAEALGDEMSKGTSWGDALSIAAVNAGIKGAVSIAGNKLTGGADKMLNRVAVLTEVGFTKLTTKQVAEYGANGISFLVVKSGQVVGQAAVEEFAGKPAMKKIADSIKSARHVSGGGSSGGGYGMSTATQPLAAY